MIEEKEELQGQLIASGNIVASMVSQKGEKGDPGEQGIQGVPGVPGQDGFSPIASVSKTGKIATITITDENGTTTAEIRDGEDGLGSGDMLKATYDTNDNGVVDNAEKVNNHTVLSDVPANAVFTDTTYTAGTGISISAENVISNTQTSAEWGNITGTLSNQTDLKSALDKKQDLTPTRLTDTSIGTSNNPYILDEMIPGYYFIETPSGSSSRYFKLTSSATGSTSVSNSASGNGYGIYLYIPKTIDTPNLNEGDIICYFDRITISSSGSCSGGLSCFTYDSTKGAKIAADSAKSYNRSFGTTVTGSAQTWSGVKTFNDVPVCETAPTNNSDLANKKYIDDGLSAKQDTLVSGTNIKTINGTSVLGSGNIDAGASIPIQDTAPLNPEEDDLWIDTANENELKYYNGSSWEIVSGEITGDTLPIGAIIPYGSTTAPTNWLVCDGSAVSRTTYAELFAVIGTSYGAGDGSTTFNLPNLKGRVAVGQDTSDTDFDTIGETGGSKALQQHTHVMGNVAGYGSTSAWGFPTQQTANMGSKSVDSAGTGNSGNLQPYQVVCYIIKAFQSAGLIAEVSNTYSESETDAYSCDYVNKLETYSTTEQRVGTWIDGKPIYRKTYEIGNLPNANTLRVQSGLTASNINIVKLYGTAIKSGTHETYPLPFIWGSTSGFTNYVGLFFGGTDNNSDIWIRTMTDASSYSGYVIIEYTKTTD